MGIISIVTDVAGQIGVNPRRVKIVTTASYATVTTAGYLNPANLMGFTISPTDFIDMTYAYNEISHTGTDGVFIVSISNGVITLASAPGNPSGATIANHLAVFTSGGALTEDVATAINGGNLQAGLSGTAGHVSSFPATASKGSLRLTAVANTGNTLTTISNVAMGQASVVSIPDPGTATANFAVAPAALVDGNLVKASGTAGLVADQGFAIKSVAGAAAAGGAATQSFTDAFCTSGSNVVGNWNTQANAASVLKIVPGTGSFVVTSSANAGVGTFNYIITK